MSETAIRFDGVGVRFTQGKSAVDALSGIDLSIDAGEVFAVIGFSGAGKSTLVRLVNGLERPTSGTVTVLGQEVTSLSPKQVRALRADVGMVFQQFNLLTSRTVYGNVAYPLEVAGWSKNAQAERVTELLNFVGLAEKAWSYPEQLSGGQKQRVGIARALATSPKILLADESTSALDPDTTREVLGLLRRINEEFGTTIVVITHELDVVRALADRVAVLESGKLVETGPVRQIFTEPTAEATRRLVGSSAEFVPAGDELGDLRSTTTGRLVTVYADDPEQLGAALGSASTHGVDLQIVHGGVTTLKHESLSTFTLSLRGDDAGVERLLESLRGAGRVEEATR
ncbi:methionine ABC transporter ATP-binding protein [Dermacoccaceae bacterium W4C1]